MSNIFINYLNCIISQYINIIILSTSKSCVKKPDDADWIAKLHDLLSLKDHLNGSLAMQIVDFSRKNRVVGLCVFRITRLRY